MVRDMRIKCRVWFIHHDSRGRIDVIATFIIFARSMINEQAFSIYKRKIDSPYYPLYVYIIDTKRLT